MALDLIEPGTGKLVRRVYEICSIRSGIDQDDEIQAVIDLKMKAFDALVAHCRTKEYKHTVAYLDNARGDLFTGFANNIRGQTTSRVERVMRTVNMRINVSKWSTRGALNVAKVRLAYYYKEFDPTNGKKPNLVGLAQVST